MDAEVSKELLLRKAVASDRSKVDVMLRDTSVMNNSTLRALKEKSTGEPRIQK